MTSSSLMNYRCQLISDLYFVGLARNNLLIDLIAYSQKFCLPVHDIKATTYKEKVERKSMNRQFKEIKFINLVKA